MSTALDFLTKDSQLPLISNKGITLTQRSFRELVERLAANLAKDTRLCSRETVLLHQDDPIEFYALMFALWENGNRVIFPTRHIMLDPSSLDFFQFSISCRDNETAVVENPDFQEGILPGYGNSVIFSSGSTGPPKGILHYHHHYYDNARAVRQRVLEHGTTSLIFLKPYLVSAISHFLVHYLTDSHLIFENFNEVHTSTPLFDKYRTMGIVGSPIHLSSGLQFIPPECQPRYFFSSGDFLPGICTKRILTNFPETIVYHVYGLAELAGRFFMHRINLNTPSKQYESVGTEIEGTRFRCTDGELFVKSDFLFKGYIKEGTFVAAGEWHSTQDIAENRPSGMFLFGRSNDEIKVLGNKVSLKRIENQIRTALNRETAVIVATPHPSFGTILSLIFDDPGDVTRAEIISALRATLKPHEIPHQYLTMHHLPFTASMKIDRRKIAEQIDTLKPLP